MEPILMISSCPNEETALTIARALITKSYAACVNVLPASTSIFNWEGEIQEETEATLLIKTTQNMENDIEELIKELHDYDMPEIISLQISSGSEDFIEWVNECVSYA